MSCRAWGLHMRSLSGRGLDDAGARCSELSAAWGLDGVGLDGTRRPRCRRRGGMVDAPRRHGGGWQQRDRFGRGGAVGVRMKTAEPYIH